MPALTDKITSEADWAPHSTNLYQQRASEYVGRMSGKFQGTKALPFWVERELVRLSKVYEKTSVTEWINERWAVFCHVSTVDRKMVAYTASAADGVQDRQTRTTVGRLLSKLCAVLSDDLIREKVDKHASDIIDPSEIEFLSGKDIAEAYENCVSGTSACMSGKTWAKHNPAEAYDMPNIRMAVLRNSEGKITRRSMVYEPSETDKRYVRVYPNDAKPFAKALEALGYKCGTWEGAEFKVLELAEFEDGSKEYRVPYLDSNASLSGVGSAVALLDGKLTSVTQWTKKALSAAFRDKYAVAMPSSYAAVRLHNLTTEMVSAVCPVSGQTYNKLTASLVWTLHKGESVLALPNPEYVQAYTHEQAERIYVKRSETVEVEGYYYHNDTDTLERHNLAELDSEWYPDERGLRARTVKTWDGRNVKHNDVVQVIKDNKRKWFHKSEITKKFVRLTRVKTLCYPGEPFLRTDTGAKVHRNTHEVTELWNGDIAFSRGLKRLRTPDCYYKSSNPPDAAFFDKLMEDESLPELVRRWCRVVGTNYVGRTWTSGIEHAVAVGNTTWENLVAALHNRSVDAVSRVHLERVAWNAKMKLAEMTALDYN